MDAFGIVLSFIVILIASAFLYVKNAFSYWKRKGVPFKQPSFPFGNFASAFLKKKSFGEELADLYNETSEPFVGVFITLQPALLVRDPQIIKDIFIKDFQSFSHRGWQANTDIDPMANNILLQRGDKWKTTRSQFTPAFSSTKVKAMFETMVNCGKTLDKYIDGFADTNKSIEMREIFSRFAINVIASVGFGFDLDCIENPDCEFRKYGQKFFEPTLKNTLRFNLSFMSPALARFCRIRFADKEVGDFMRETFRQNLEYREKNNVVRKDFFQLLIQLQNTGKIHEDDVWTTNATNDAKSLSLDEMTAQAFLFFAGGFESSSSTMSFLMYELAKHPEKQQKAYEEIVEILEKHDGTMSYEAIIDMKYMGHCIDETLRLHPPFPVTSRMCTKTYKIPDTDVIIDEGTTLLFSAIGLQYDSKYYEKPKQFIPERYSDTSVSKSFVEMPNLVFGEGPRNCLGIRFGKLQPKIGVVLLLRQFRFELADEHKNTELKLDPACVVLTPINGINLKVYRR